MKTDPAAAAAATAAAATAATAAAAATIKMHGHTKPNSSGSNSRNSSGSSNNEDAWVYKTQKHKVTQGAGDRAPPKVTDHNETRRQIQMSTQKEKPMTKIRPRSTRVAMKRREIKSNAQPCQIKFKVLL